MTTDLSKNHLSIFLLYVSIYLPISTMPPRQESAYPIVIWSANNKRLIWMIFTILEEDDTIRRGIWPQKGNHYKNLAQEVPSRNFTHLSLKMTEKLQPTSENR